MTLKLSSQLVMLTVTVWGISVALSIKDEYKLNFFFLILPHLPHVPSLTCTTCK